MKRITVHIEEAQYDWLHKEAETLGVTAAEVLRQGLVHWMNVSRHPLQGLLTKMADPEYSRRKEHMAAEIEAAWVALGEKPRVSLETIAEQLRSIEITVNQIARQQEAKGSRKK